MKNVDIVLNKLIPRNHNDIGYENFPKEVRSKEVKKRLDLVTLS